MRFRLGWLILCALTGPAAAQGMPTGEPVAVPVLPVTESPQTQPAVPGPAAAVPATDPSASAPTVVPAAAPGSTSVGGAPSDKASVAAPLVTGGPIQPSTPGKPARAAPYSLPWGLRPIIPVTVLRFDSVVATYRSNDSLGVTTTILPLVGYRFTPHFMGVARWGLIGNAAPDGTSGVSISNAALGGIWGLKLPANLRLAFFLGATIPIGTGGAKAVDPLSTAATSAGLYSRSAMDNAMFAVNDFTLFPGIDVAYVGHGVTVQIEATVLQLMRVKNEATQTDAFRTNFTTGIHLGYFLTKWLTLTVELRYQRWLSTPDAVAADETLRDNLSLALGPRFHVKLAKGFLRPGIAYNAGLAGRLGTSSYHMVLLDIPYVM